MTENRQGLPPASSFEDLEVFKRAYKASLAVHRKSLEFPAIEQRGLADQVRRASKSICANVAEGFARQGVQPADFRRFLDHGIGLGRRDAGVAALLPGSRLYRRGDLADLAPGVSRDRQNAAGPDQGAAGARVMRRLVCHLSSVLCSLAR